VCAEEIVAREKSDEEDYIARGKEALEWAKEKGDKETQEAYGKVFEWLDKTEEL
jgi:hypothetical protein